MAYAGIQTMLLAYKMRKSDKEFELTQISQKLMAATRDASDYAKAYQAGKNALIQEFGSEDEPGYEVALDDLTEQRDLELAELAEWEDNLEQQQSNCETEISMLDGYINSWQSALQQNIAKDHTYGAVQ